MGILRIERGRVHSLGMTVTTWLPHGTPGASLRCWLMAPQPDKHDSLSRNIQVYSYFPILC
jgi:hypothetical protein